MDPHNAVLWMVTLPLAASPVIYLAGRIFVRATPGRKGACAPACWLAVLALLATWVPFVIVAQSVLSGSPVEIQVGAVPLRVDGISVLLGGTALLLGTLVLVFSIPYMSGEEGEEKYYALMPAMVGTIIGLGCANDLFNLWVWFEAMAVSSYLLVAFYTNERGALEAGVKYLVQSAVGSVLVLLGIAIVFSQVRTLHLDLIVRWPGSPSLVMLAAGALFIIGFGIKAAVVPLHTWLPDAHSQAPSGISAMLSGVVIEAGLVAMLRALGNLPVPGQAATWGNLLLIFGALNMLVGNLMALRQTQIKRLLAYSSLSHIGYMLLGFGVAAIFHNSDAAAGGFFHLLNHALMKGLAFLATGVLLYTLHIARGSHSPLTVDDLNGAAQRYPLPAFALSLAVLALGGLPPLAGFMSKWQIFAGGVETHNLAIIGLVVFAALNSVLSLGYYAPLVNRMYRKAPSPAVRAGVRSPALMVAPLVVLALVVVVLGFWPGLVSPLSAPAADTLSKLFGGLSLAVH
jgi:proton-translocating NADH-quinone oxidoreductase chain N